MSILDVRHQAGAQRLLQRALVADRVPHAYMFHGPDGVGKEMLARSLAQLLLCPRATDVDVPPEDVRAVGIERARVACGMCDDCRTAAAGTHQDVHIVHRRLNRYHPDGEIRKRKALELGVDIVRYFLIDKVAMTPARGRAKVFIVLEADRITQAAQNAMLKTLEEPPGTTFLILLVQSIDTMLPTTVSRCQTVALGPLPIEFILSRLREKQPDLTTEQLAWYAGFACGSVGRAVECVEEGLYDVNARVVEWLALLPGRSPDFSFASWADEAKSLAGRYKRRDEDISETEAQRRGFKTILALAAAFFADVARHGCGASKVILNKPGPALVWRCADAVSPTIAADIITRIVRTEAQLDMNANVQLCIETSMDDIAAIAAGRGEPIVTLRP